MVINIDPGFVPLDAAGNFITSSLMSLDISFNDLNGLANYFPVSFPTFYYLWNFALPCVVMCEIVRMLTQGTRCPMTIE